jgi:hypothetical protein
VLQSSGSGALFLVPTLLVIALLFYASYYMYTPLPCAANHISSYAPVAIQPFMPVERVVFRDQTGRDIVVIHMDTGDIEHNFSNLDEAGKAAADAFWGAFGSRLKKIRQD